VSGGRECRVKEKPKMFGAKTVLLQLIDWELPDCQKTFFSKQRTEDRGKTGPLTEMTAGNSAGSPWERTYPPYHNSLL